MENGFTTTAIGIMSGTSLDGLDLCCAEFRFDEGWNFRIIEATCVEYDPVWREKLSTAHQLSNGLLRQFHVVFGQFIGQQVNDFLEKTGRPTPDLICSHGHTVYHQPEKGITLQIGDGQTIADTTGITCVNDFRSLDVSLGGQGAPLVPIGDELLFSEFDACLNLGGFSNISFTEGGERRAFDICPVNIVLNPLADQLGFHFDKGGEIARSGKLNTALLKDLNALNVYQKTERPSLAREWLESDFNPVVETPFISVEDKLRTVTEHMAFQITEVLDHRIKQGRVLVTGGGTKNTFLMERISALSDLEVIIPEQKTVDNKEALIFAFLGVLRIQNQINVLRSVTGAERDSCSGAIHHPKD